MLQESFQQIINNPIPSLAIIGNLIIIESLLSVDNAAVLATMVMDLKQEEREKALKYGILGAYVFRGLCLLFASWLIQFWFLKVLGGLYLLYLVYDYFKSKSTPSEDDDTLNKEENWFYKMTIGAIGKFWATVALVELMDLAFSIDNVFAAVALSPNLILVWLGVFIGILAMRFVAQGFVTLMEKYPFLETAAFIVIGILGSKLVFSLYEHHNPDTALTQFMTSHAADWGVSIITLLVFITPIITSILFNFPSKKAED